MAEGRPYGRVLTCTAEKTIVQWSSLTWAEKIGRLYPFQWDLGSGRFADLSTKTAFGTNPTKTYQRLHQTVPKPPIRLVPKPMFGTLVHFCYSLLHFGTLYQTYQTVPNWYTLVLSTKVYQRSASAVPKLLPPPLAYSPPTGCPGETAAEQGLAAPVRQLRSKGWLRSICSPCPGGIKKIISVIFSTPPSTRPLPPTRISPPHSHPSPT